MTRSHPSQAQPKLVADFAELREAVDGAHRAGKSIGVVPTMGALHVGHLSLVRASAEACDSTIVTIFVNRTQFGTSEDLADYPRTLDNDLRALADLDVDVVFCPQDEAVYPAGFSTYVEPPREALRWEGECRPGHFRGVTTVVLKLLLLTGADEAFFGEKDYQQLKVVQRIVADLNVPSRIRACPIVREPDGLACSSRNQYLSTSERQRALALSRGLARAQQLWRKDVVDAEQVSSQMCDLLHEGVDRIDYVALVDPETLEEVGQVTADTRALIAAHVGTTRLIDNCRLGDAEIQ